MGLVAVLAGTARLALLGWLLARVFRGEAFVALVIPLVLVALVIVTRGVLEHYRTMVAHDTAVRVQSSLRALLYDHVTSLGPAYFTRARTGDVIVSMVEGVQQLETYFGQYLPQLCVAVLTPILIFLFVAFIDVPVALVMLAAALLTLIAPTAWHRRETARSRGRSQAYSSFAAEFLDSVQGLPTLKAFGQSGARARLLQAKSTALFHTTMGVLRSNVLGRGITDAGMAVGAAVALAYGVYRVRAGEMELGALLVILMLGVEVFRPLRELRVLLHQGMLGVSAARGILDILDGEPLVCEAASSVDDGPPLTPTVAFDNVTFVYPEPLAGARAFSARVPAHHGLTFSVGVGERVAFVGASGAGKSTIARLLLRFYDPTHGRVLVGNRDVRELSFERLRGLIAVVNQDTYLFHGTVEDNLRMGKPDATPSELEAAARVANAHAFIAQLPQGYRTIVGERGVRLSGGQRQRIAIARALLRDTPILVLDEALSSVDAESEAAIQQALDRLMRGRTTLIFAHRLSSVIGADRTFVLDHGSIAEEGTHSTLMAGRGLYYRLMSAQAATLDGGRLVDGGRAAVPAVTTNGGDDADTAEAGDATTEPTEGIVQAEGMTWPQLIRILLGMIRGYRLRLTTTFVLGVTRVAALIGVGLVSSLIVRAVKHGAPLGGLLVALAIVAPLAGVLHWLESWLAHDMAYRLLADMRLDMFRTLDRLAPAYFTRRRAGDLVGVATYDIELIEYFFAHTVTPAFVAILVPTVVLVTLGSFGWPLAVAVLPFLVWAGGSPFLARERIDRLGSRARELSGVLNAHAVDTVQGLGEIVAFQRVRARGQEFAGRARAYFDARQPYLADLSRQTALQEIATGLGGLAVIAGGTALAARGRLDPAILPLLVLLAMSAFVPVWEIAQVGRQLADTLGAARRVHAVHREPVVVQDGPGVPMRAPAGGLALEMSHVHFTYPGRRRPALTDVSFAVPRGATVAIVGPSGAGKTTVASLFLRFWDPEAGVVRLDGHQLREYRLDDLRGRIALVAQDTYLFNDSLRQNVLIARPSASEDDVRAALDKAALTEFVATLPDGLETVVGERGAQLSGGQRQRVAIARAFLKDAPILILDEATSHLDALNEAAVRGALDVLARGRTTLVIAHRLSTVRDADRIVVLDDGRVAEIGTHRTLLEGRGLYARLISHQLAATAGATA